MWERFTERAKRVVSAAREEATRLNSEYVRTEHILLGLCREPEGIAARALENLGVDIEALAVEIEQQCQRGTASVSGDEIASKKRAGSTTATSAPNTSCWDSSRKARASPPRSFRT
jgi:ATP-dependent Clp protease ATP-binding subunit ClpA